MDNLKQSTEFFHEERLKELAADPKNRVYKYEYDQVLRVMTADECRPIVKQMYAKVKTLRSQDVRKAIVQIHALLTSDEEAYAQVVDDALNTNENLTCKMLFQYLSDRVSTRLFKVVDEQWTGLVEKYEELIEKMVHFQNIEDVEFSTQPLPLSMEEQANHYTVVNGPPLKRTMVPVPELNQQMLKDLHVYCQRQRPVLWMQESENIEKWWESISEERFYALVNLDTVENLNDVEESLQNFILWRKFHPEIKTLDIRENMQKNKDWTEFISTHLSIFEFITDPRMTDEFFKKGILYMIYVKKMVENDMYKDANEAKKLISERLVSLFTRPDVRVIKEDMDKFMARRFKEDESHKKKIQDRIL